MIQIFQTTRWRGSQTEGNCLSQARVATFLAALAETAATKEASKQLFFGAQPPRAVERA